MSPDIEGGFSKTRLEFLTDGVFAIVMTLLVLEIAVPELSHSEVATELPRQLFELWPIVLSYVTSFIILGVFWIFNNEMFRYIKRANRTLLWITIFYLMFVAFIPFSTALLGEYGDQQISVIIYAINITIAGFWVNVQWWYATKNHRLVDSDLDSDFVRMMSRRLPVWPIMYLIAIAVSFVSIETSLIMYIATPLYYLVLVRKEEPWFWFTKSKAGDNS
jgi:uncharacterized membrane protein